MAKRWLWLGAMCIGFLLVSSTGATVAESASSITLTFSTSENRFTSGVDNQGWWSPTIAVGDSNDNYIVGRCCGGLHRDFFTFDLSGFNNCTVSSAVLKLRHRGSQGSATHELSIFDVSTDAATLNKNIGTSTVIYDDLGTGTLYGSVSVPNGATGVEGIVLNAAALADIQASIGGFFSVGGSITNLAPSGEDYLFGSSGDESNQLDVECMPTEPVFCDGHPALHLGTDGDDVIEGTARRDIIHGLGGNDVVRGHGGNDVMCGGDGDDTIDGNRGNDRIFGGPGNDVLNGGLGSDVVKGEDGNDRVMGGWGDGATDIVAGGPGNDRAFGGDGDDFMWGGGGYDLLYGGDGDDLLQGNHRWDLLRGGPGNDILYGDQLGSYTSVGPDPAGDNLFGDEGDDQLFGQEGDDDLDGGRDTDACDGGPGANTAVNCE